MSIVEMIVRRLSAEPALIMERARQTIRFNATNEMPDEYNTIIRVEGWDLKDYLANPVVFWAHESKTPPIGMTRSLQNGQADIAGKCYRALFADIAFADRKTYAFGALVYRLYAKRFLRGVSVGFRTTKATVIEDADELARLGLRPPMGEILERNVLKEISAAPIPGNAGALSVELAGYAGEMRMTNFRCANPPEDGKRLEEWCLESLESFRALEAAAGAGAILRAETQATEIQSYVFPKSQWTKEEAENWLKEHKARHDSARETETSLRFRQFPPEDCEEGSLVTLTENFPKGMSAVACKRKQSSESAPELDLGSYPALAGLAGG